MAVTATAVLVADAPGGLGPGGAWSAPRGTRALFAGCDSLRVREKSRSSLGVGDLLPVLEEL